MSPLADQHGPESAPGHDPPSPSARPEFATGQADQHQRTGHARKKIPGIDLGSCLGDKNGPGGQHPSDQGVFDQRLLSRPHQQNSCRTNPGSCCRPPFQGDASQGSSPKERHGLHDNQPGRVDVSSGIERSTQIDGVQPTQPDASRDRSPQGSGSLLTLAGVTPHNSRGGQRHNSRQMTHEYGLSRQAPALHHGNRDHHAPPGLSGESLAKQPGSNQTDHRQGVAARLRSVVHHQVRASEQRRYKDCGWKRSLVAQAPPTPCGQDPGDHTGNSVPPCRPLGTETPSPESVPVMVVLVVNPGEDVTHRVHLTQDLGAECPGFIKPQCPAGCCQTGRPGNNQQQDQQSCAPNPIAPTGNRGLTWGNPRHGTTDYRLGGKVAQGKIVARWSMTRGRLGLARDHRPVHSCPGGRFRVLRAPGSLHHSDLAGCCTPAASFDGRNDPRVLPICPSGK